MRNRRVKIATATQEVRPDGRLLEIFFVLQVVAPGLCLIYMYLVPQVADTPYQVQFNIAAVWLVISALLLYFRDTLNSGSLSQVKSASPATTDQDWIRLFHSFEQDHLYRRPGLTIGTLAKKLNMPVYRLRDLVNNRLGYRNFKALLHEYRIKDACAELSNPDHAHLPILTIALGAGYESINPFNRAFRKLKGMTPTEFRNQALNRQ